MMDAGVLGRQRVISGAGRSAGRCTGDDDTGASSKRVVCAVARPFYRMRASICEPQVRSRLGASRVCARTTCEVSALGANVRLGPWNVRRLALCVSPAEEVAVGDVLGAVFLSISMCTNYDDESARIGTGMRYFGQDIMVIAHHWGSID